MKNFDLRPKMGRPFSRSQHGTLLLICHYSLESISTIYDSIRSIQDLSRFDIEIMNVWPIDALHRPFPKTIDLNRYSGIIIHNTFSYDPAVLWRLDAFLPLGLRSFQGVKIVMKQDEHVLTGSFRDFIVAAGVDIVTTCLREQDIPVVYGEVAAQSITWITTLTAYLTDDLVNMPYVPLSERSVDIGYRGSYQPLFCGRLGYEKWSIGTRVAAHADAQALNLDISSRPTDLIPQNQWFLFLSNCRSTLGVESGSNIFDFDGEVGRLCEVFASSHRDMPRNSAEYYAAASEAFLSKFEDNVDYGQIGPRHIEAIATRTLLILYEGNYSGIIEPYRHYFPLKRDLSNFHDAVALLKDDRRVEEITSAARDHLISNETLTYRSFVNRLDEAILRVVKKKVMPQVLSSSHPRRNRVLILCSHHPESDPRISWVRSWFESDAETCEIGIHRRDTGLKKPSVECINQNQSYRVLVERQLHDYPWLPCGADDFANADVGRRSLLHLDRYARATPNELSRLLGAHIATEREVAALKSRCRYFVDTNSALMQAALDLGHFNLVVAADLETLPAAIVLKHAYSCPAVYDAHEFWPASFDDMPTWEREWWSSLERRLVVDAEKRITVSGPLARFMSQEYGVEFEVAPNAVTLASAPAVVTEKSVRRNIEFLFLGGFASGRGIELLIDIWSRVPARAKLTLRGPTSQYRQAMIDRAKALGTYGNGVEFPDPVAESELITAAMTADVGIIAYEPNSLNNRWCCPNKLSQYMAAGLPILANTTGFVGPFVEKNGIGVAVNFKDDGALLAAIERMVADDGARLEMGQVARRVFVNEFNWEVQTAGLRSAVLALACGTTRELEPLRFDRLLGDPSLTAQIQPVSSYLDAHISNGALRHGLRSIWRLLPRSTRIAIANSLGI